MDWDALPRLPDTYVVYRAFDPSGQLLYVGRTKRFRERMTSHRRLSAWWAEATSITIEAYATQVDAAHAERAAIANERPRFNRPDGGGEASGRATGGRHRESPAGFTGVTKRRGRFHASAWRAGHHYGLGTFDTAEEASRAYEEFVERR